MDSPETLWPHYSTSAPYFRLENTILPKGNGGNTSIQSHLDHKAGRFIESREREGTLALIS